MKRVSSRRHQLVATCRALLSGGRGAPPDRILLDGMHLVAEARRAGVRIDAAAFAARALATDDGRDLAAALEQDGTEVVEVTDQVMDALSPASTPSGMVAVAVRPIASLSRVLTQFPQAVVVAADVQDPGNAGAIVRAAEAGAATGVVFCGASADPFGWKALRGSMGSALRLPLARVDALDDAIESARAAGARIVATLPRGGARPDEVNLRVPVAFLLGSEGSGLPPDVIETADARVSIPMQSPVESLNVAVAAALLVYETARQRRRTPVDGR